MRPPNFKSTPTWQFEQLYSGRVAGVDEAGRGPLAGPVVTAAVVLDKGNIPSGLNDSKALSKTRREYLYDQIWASASVGIGIAEPEEIDRLNILAATMQAMQRAIRDLHTLPDAVLVDGNKCPDFGLPAQSIVKGDSKSLSIAAASIIAKVTRDKLMTLAGERFPGYDFAQHKAYPTQSHRSTLSTLGPCPLHRRSYAPVKAALTGMNNSLKTK